MSLTLNTSTTTTTTPAGGGGGGPPQFLLPSTTATFPLHRQLPSSLFLVSARSTSHIAGATNKSTPRTGKFESKNRRNSSSEQDKSPGRRTTLEKRGSDTVEDVIGGGGAETMESFADDGFVMPDLPGRTTDFWEGSKWDGLGFFVQYMWAFGIAFALVACGIAVATFNEGATDFKSTPVFKESLQSQELLEEPEASNSDVFESNPTEEAPSLE